jgi:hypothetical protein
MRLPVRCCKRFHRECRGFPIVSTRAPSAAVFVACALAALAGLLAAAPGASAQVRYQAKITDANRVGLTVTNYAFFGNNFISRTPSLEYPLGEGLEHLSRAGLWIGGLAITDTGEELRVSHAVLDNAQGTNQVAETEFTPLPGPMVERSRLVTSKFFSRDAVSDQDFVASFTDRPARAGSSFSSEDHVPLGVNVRLSTYAFGLDAAADFVVLHFEITNDGPPLRDAWVGLYSQLVSGDKNAYPTWPPSGSAPAGSWYYKKYMTWVDSLSMVAEHYCTNAVVGPDDLPDPGTCNFQVAPAWAASQFLGVRAGTLVPDPSSLRLNVRFWNYEPGDTTRDEDVERYALMAREGVDDPAPLRAGAAPNLSPIELITVGPFPEIPPDSTISVDFAFVGGREFRDLAAHAAFARYAFEQNYRLPAPPPSPRLHVRARDEAIELLWDDVSERTPDETSPAPGGLDFEGYRVYVGRDPNDLARVAQFDLADTVGFDTGLEAIRLAEPVIEGGDTLRYAYRIGGLRDGFTYTVAVTAFDLGDEQVGPLESGLNENKQLAVPNPAPGERAGVVVYPNPYRVEAAWDAGRLVRDHYLWFANLPARARLRIFTLAGDLVYDFDFDGATYDGATARGLYDPNANVGTPPPALSGASFAWDLITKEGQAAASGLYLWAVEDRATGAVERGKFLIVKSDREGFR